MVSLGGAIGAALVGIVAPLVLPAHFELALGADRLRGPARVAGARRRARLRCARASLPVSRRSAARSGRSWISTTSTIVTARNFYGVLRVQETGVDDVNLHRSLIHGTIMHGQQYLAPTSGDVRRATTRRRRASAACSKRCIPRKEPLRVGVIGLGTGTLAAYGTPGDLYRFYDINPAVVAIARRDFTYLADSEARIETPLGDARLTLEREPPADLDLLAIDAFSSDAIPVHLITSEALALYARHIKPGRRHRVPRDQPLSSTSCPSSPRSPPRTTCRRSGSTTRARTRWQAAATGCWCRTTAQLLAQATHRGSREPDRGASRMAAVDRRLQQPVPGAAPMTPPPQD